MRRPGEFKFALEALRHRLAGRRETPRVRSKQVTYVVPPLIPQRVIFGINLHNLMIPPCYTPIPKIVEAYEKLIGWRADGSPADYADLILEDLDHRAQAFIAFEPAKLLVWAGRHRDLRLNTEGGCLIVEGEQTFGMGVDEVFVRDTVLPWTEGLAAVEVKGEGVTRDTGFISLWTRAQALNDAEALDLLGAVKVGARKPFLEMAPWLRHRSDDKGVDPDALGQLIENDVDPIGAMYTRFVPTQMSRKEFENKFGALEGRRLDLTSDEREKLWERCRGFGLV